MNKLQVLYSFQNEFYQITEVKKLDTESKDPGKIYFWVVYNKHYRTLERLAFVSMSLNERIFSQGTLTWKENKTAEFSTKIDTMVLQKSETLDINSDVAKFVESFL